MKNLLLIGVGLILLCACKKQAVVQDPVQHYLSEKLAAADYASLDFLHLVSSDKIIRIPFLDKKSSEDFLLLALGADGAIRDGRILHIEGAVNHGAYDGQIEYWSLDRSIHFSSIVQKGFILGAHETYTINAATTQRTSAVECRDCTIPEVIVSASYPSAYNYDYDPFAWLNLFWLFGDDMPKSEYLPLDGGGGGGGASSTIDTEETENREKIDAKKFMDCFDQIADAGATCTITISTDIPVDNRPDQFFDPAAGAVGHAFIELWKMSPGGQLISQTIGFYPAGSLKAATGLRVESKIVDNAFHEYNARYTIAVTPAQLRAATGQVLALENANYNLAGFNCTDFALSVFNAAGGGLSIPKYQIPAYGTTGGSNTPQGLYQQLMSMAAAGNAGVQTNGAKGYAGSSHGPCN